MNGLYLVTDRAVAEKAGHSLAYVVTQACRAGVHWIQLREKNVTTRAFIEIGAELKQITQTYGAKLIVNDRVDVALAIDADGVHVGQDDMPYPKVRSLLGPDKIVGLSVNNVAELEAIDATLLDYLGIATIFATGTKTDTTSLLGLDGLHEICQRTTLPTFAIGGINVTNIQQVIRAGASGAAVVSAICGQPSPYEASRELILMSERAKE